MGSPIKPEVGSLLATQRLLEHERIHGQVWDAAHRDDGIIDGLIKAGIASFHTSFDFLTYWHRMPNVITEPLPRLGDEYARRALEIVTGKVALLLPVSFLSLPSSKVLFSATPLVRIYVMTEKLVHRKTKMVWAVWEKGNFEPPIIRFI